MRLQLPSTLLLFIFSLLPSAILADPANIPFTDCFDELDNIDQKLNVTTVYAQVLQNQEWGNYLNLTVLGTSPKDILGLANSSTSLATLFTSTSVLTLSAWSNSSYLCQNMRPPSPLPSITSTDNSFCPISAGPFAFSSTIPWGKNRELTTLITRLRAVDPFGKELLCIDLLTTPLDPGPQSPYGKAKIIFWSTIALTISYWLVVGAARIASAWGRGITRPGGGIWSRAQSAGYILASAISGERLTTSPALMRFGTPSMRDIFFHTQWCTILAMVAVEWPQFIYPLLTQTSWSTLSYNVSLTESSKSHHWHPLDTAPFIPPEGFSEQLSDPNSPLFIDPSIPNVIFTLPPGSPQGMSTFAYTLGIRPQDLFSTCLILFLGIIAGTIAVSLLLWLVDYVASLINHRLGGQTATNTMNRLTRTRSPGYIINKDSPETSPPAAVDENRSFNGSGHAPFSARSTTKFALPLGSAGVASERGINTHRAWWRFRSESGTFHGSVLHGNLVRILVLFHLPVTIFSCYQMTMSRAMAGSTTPIVLAALSFVIFSILIPAHLVIRVTFTTTNKLYDETRTLLSLGPLYNHYRHGSQLFAILFFATNIATGVTVGAGQKSGTAQAIIILVIEVVSALVTSIWLPWGSGASMGLISFLFCVARIVVAVLLVILTQAISIGPGPGAWVAYGILIILALVYLALLLMLLVKIVEGFVRLFGRIPFDCSKHVIDSGLLGACGMLGCGSTSRKRRRRKAHSKARSQDNASHAQTRDSDLSSYMPPSMALIGKDGNVTPQFLNSQSRKGSANSQPPSVLKPEHANRPYHEEPLDSDDDGYIMGAWQPFPKTAPGYAPVTDAAQTTAPTAFGQSFQKPKTPIPAAPVTGFSRVGGGRANMDSPYAIRSGSTHTFPSIGQQSQSHSPLNQSTSAVSAQHPLANYDSIDDRSEDAPLSLSNVSLGANGLPQGAMQPSHIRTKSQTAIVENFIPTPYQQPAAGPSHAQINRQKHLSQDTYLKPDLPLFKTGHDDGDEGSDDDHSPQKKKKPWYHIRRNRPHSSEGRPSVQTAQSGDEELGVLTAESSAAAQPQRSFVVIRKNQGRSNQGSDPTTPSSTYPRTSSRPPTR
ncbi:hypothetical protein CVT24_005789 [Panaeolus cyanescens]|uniref:TRP C-terminal domain-containing protein n=1 Tax=Panaeolus cyanescens TaxID=181874 RepID=A0A409VB74_9AGAR|nr:hypothetical protein CVT24_005789 [Panaeolus cyanescens]